MPLLLAFTTGLPASSAEPAGQGSDSFPDLNQVLEGRVFHNTFERDVFFLRQIRQNYAGHWPSLLAVNLTVKDYVQAPEKMRRFIEELGAAMAAQDDLAAITNLAAVVSSPAFYANTNAYRPEILGAAAAALIQTGPRGEQALAEAFTEAHYRKDPVSLEVIAEAIGKSGAKDSSLSAALAATAFTLTATNGGSYPRCTTEAIGNLLRLPQGASAIRAHLDGQEVFKDPGRFEEVIDAIGAAGNVTLRTNLIELGSQVAAKLKALPSSSNPYRDDLLDLQNRITRALSPEHQVSPKDHPPAAPNTSNSLTNGAAPR